MNNNWSEGHRERVTVVTQLNDSGRDTGTQGQYERELKIESITGAEKFY